MLPAVDISIMRRGPTLNLKQETTLSRTRLTTLEAILSLLQTINKQRLFPPQNQLIISGNFPSLQKVIFKNIKTENVTF